MPGPSLGLNLSGVVDWSSAFPFVDQFKLSRGWVTQRDGVWDTGRAGMLNLDADGWVRGFTRDGSRPPFDAVATIWNSSGAAPRPGLYVIDWKGQGTLDVQGGAQIVSRSDHKVVLDPGNNPVQIRILSTDPAKTGNYIRDIRIYHEQDKALLDAGLVFNPDFIDRIEDFRVLRFMDWMGTNNSPVSSWSQTGDAGDARHTSVNGVSVETMVALANEVRADPWFTIPHRADAAFIRNFAAYVRDNLAPGLVARFEYSNEMWNWGFGQAHWAADRAEAAWGDDVEGGWMQWYGVRAAQMARIVADVFGRDTGTRALNVFSTQSGWQGLEHYALEAPDHVDEGGRAPRDAPFHVYAIAPYFGGSIGSADMVAQVDRWIAQGPAGFRAALNWLAQGPADDSIKNLEDVIRYHAGVARDLGWRLEAYEGGQHIVDVAGGAHDPDRTAFFTALAKRPGMAELYETYFETWREAGGKMMAHYADFGVPGRHGSWGLWNSVYGRDTPRGTAVEEFRDDVAPWWRDPRPASVFNGIETRVDRADAGRLTGGAGRDRLFGLDGDDRLAGGRGADALYGSAGRDRLLGGPGGDRLEGGAGPDVLLGGEGSDRLRGGGGEDRLEGGAGRDWLDGGADRSRDVFVFEARTDSPAGAGRDVIAGFDAGVDEIDLRAVDAWASTRGANEAFAFAGRAAAAQSVWWTPTEDGVLLRADVTGDAAADHAVQLRGVTSLTAGDVHL